MPNMLFATALFLAVLAAGAANGPAAAEAPPLPEWSRPAGPLPDDLEWLTNDTDPVYASPEARHGGTWHEALLSFPMTFRTVGPDSNGSFRGAILANQLSLIGRHPNTERIVPELATHWAFGADKRSMYFRIDPAARWSDGVPVTAADWVYTLQFMRSKEIVAPWYNDYYTREIDRVEVYDDHTLKVVGTKAQPDLHLNLNLAPTPRHYYGTLPSDFVRRYNWKIVPNTGPYQITAFRKGKSVTFSRRRDWWARDLRYFTHRFNVNRVIYTVVRDFNMQWEYFKRGRLDAFALTLPNYWHDKSDIPEVRSGYVERIWFFNDTPQSAMGLWLNLDRPIFADPRVRYAFAHAMNVERVIEKVLRGDYLRLEQHYVGYGRYTNPDVHARRFDLDKVGATMTAAGWRRGADGIWTDGERRFAVEVTYSFDEHTPRLVVLKEEARKAGIELRLQRLDSSAAFKKFLEKRHDVAWMGWSTGLRPAFWQHYHSANAHTPQTNNITNTDDPELDALIDAYRDALVEDERIDLSHRIQERLHAVGGFVPTFMVPYFREAYWRWWRLPEPPATRVSGSLFAPFDSATGGLFWYDAALHDETRAAMKKKRPFTPVTVIDETFKPRLQRR